MIRSLFISSLMALGICIPGILFAKVDLTNLNNPFGEPPFSGSVSVLMNQFFMDDARLSNVHLPQRSNAEHRWGAYHFDALFGVYEFKFGLEPLIGLGFMKNSSQVLEGGSYADYRYLQLNTSVGVRYKPYGADFFFVQPYIQTLGRYNFLRVVKYDSIRHAPELGGDFGMEAGGGLIISFLFDASQKHALRSEWDLKDLGLITSARILKAGWITKAPYGLDTSGWDFGLGLFADW